MIINGIEINKPITKIFAFDYNGSAIAFEAKAVSDFSDFDKICPRPLPKMRVDAKTNVKVPHFDDEAYKLAQAIWIQRKTDWMYLVSLSATAGLKWDTVVMDNPETFGNWRKDLIASGLPAYVITTLEGLVEEANLLSDEKLEEAKKRFLAGRVAAAAQ